ncbi:hypothetical protein RI367_007533 [Sorochytrium milnesiophthora]
MSLSVALLCRASAVQHRALALRSTSTTLNHTLQTRLRSTWQQPSSQPLSLLERAQALSKQQKRSVFSFFSSSYFHKPPELGYVAINESDQLRGDLKSRLKQDRREAVEGKEKRKVQSLAAGSTKVILTAMASNLCLMSMKFYAAYSTNSASMFAEGIHSLADLLNECLLFFGVIRAQRTPDLLHPYGYSRERYAWALMSGVGIFFLGGGVSFYHGVTSLADSMSGFTRPIEDLHIAYSVLAGSLLFEGGTAMVALRQVRKAARENGVTVMEYIKNGSDPSAVQVLLEDAAAVSGIALASTCLALSHYLNNPLFDAGGSIGIGVLLGATATFLIRRNISMLVETSMPAARLNRITTALITDPVVKTIHDVKTTSMGPEYARFKAITLFGPSPRCAEVQFDGETVTRRYLHRHVDMQAELQIVQNAKTIEDLEHFLTRHGDGVIETLADEVDRLEIKIKQTAPEVKHADLEIL